MRRLILATALLAGCGESAGPTPELAATRMEIEGIVKRYHGHFTNAELDPILAMLDPEFSLVWDGFEPLHGREAAGNKLKDFLDYFKSADLIGKRKATFQEIRVTQEGNLATAMYQVFFIISPDKPPITEAYLQVFKRSGGKWMLYREHRSAKR